MFCFRFVERFVPLIPIEIDRVVDELLIMSEWETPSLLSRRKTSRLDVSLLLSDDGRQSSAPVAARPSEWTLDVTDRFRAELSRGTAPAPAAVHVLTDLIRASRTETIMGLEMELRNASDKMMTCLKSSSLSLKAACELFLRYVARASLDLPGFEECKARLIERGERFRLLTDTCRESIARFGAPFIANGNVVMTHGGSRVVGAILERAALVSKTSFRVVVTEGRFMPETLASSSSSSKAAAQMGSSVMGNKTLDFCRLLLSRGIAVTLIPDSAVAAMMETVDCVLLGAEAVVESGAVINQVGSLNIALAAKSLNVKVFVAAETYKFARIYPLTQQDLPNESIPKVYRQLFRNDAAPKELLFESPSSDIMPPHLVSLLFTDLGVLTPAAVSEELIKLYQ